MEFEENEEFEPEKQKIAIYSKWAILGFSVFFSPVVGSVLLMLNLRSIGNKRAGYMVLVFGIVYIFVAGFVLLKLAGIPFTNADPQKLRADPHIIYYSKALDIVGAAILTEFFFRRYFPDNDYERKSIWVPLLIMLLLTFLFVA